MDEFLSLCAAEKYGSDDGESFVTAPSETTVHRSASSTDMKSLLSEDSVAVNVSGDDSLAYVSFRSSDHDKTFNDDLVQSQIDELNRKRSEVINLARATIFGSGLTENVKSSELKKETVVAYENKKDPQSGLKLVDLDFNAHPMELETTSSVQFSFNSNSSDGEMMDRRRNLNESGKLLRKQLTKIEKQREVLRDIPIHSTIVNQKSRNTVLTGVAEQEYVPPTVFDNFFRLKIKNPKISSSTFQCYVDGHKRIKISELKLSTASTADSWTTVGVIVNRSFRKSANGKDYLIWKLHDLKNCQDLPVTLLIFGEACKEFWKLQVGVCVALMTPQIVDSDHSARVGGEGKLTSRNTTITLKAFKSVQIVELGFSSELGTCKGIKVDGQRCSNFVNVSLSEFCVHHVIKEARRLSAKRGAFNSITSHPPPRKAAKLDLGIASRTEFTNRQAPTTTNMTGITTTKAEERTKLKEIIGDRAHFLGARNMACLTNSKKLVGGKIQSQTDGSSMMEFIKKQSEIRQPATSLVPQLGKGLHGRKNVDLVGKLCDESSTSLQDPARLRAIAILRRRKEGPANDSKPLKRQNEDKKDQEGCERSMLSSIPNEPDLELLLKKKSLHDSELSKAQGIAMQKHLDSLEQREKVETFVSECMAVKNVKVVSCKKCGYTAQKRSEFCMREGHLITKGIAEKRFFRCSSCCKRTIAYGMMPAKACEHCHENEWIRVPMKDERKVHLENEKLLVRGEERKFVNS